MMMSPWVTGIDGDECDIGDAVDDEIEQQFYTRQALTYIVEAPS